MKLTAIFLALAVLASLSFAATTDLGTFTCPSSQVEDPDCAASCCSYFDGSYSYSDESCEVQQPSDWQYVVQCEQSNNCCTSAYTGTTSSSSYPSSSSSGCCGSAAILLSVLGLGAFAKSRLKK